MQGKQIFSRLILILAVGCTMMAVGAGSAWSADLRTSKAAGLIGEQPNGYLGVVGAAPADVQELVRDINQKRKAVYQDIATKNGTPLQAVEQMAGKKTIKKTAQGQFIRTESGEWIKK